MLDVLAPAGARVADRESQPAQRTVEARGLSVRLAALTATARDRAGLISVTVESYRLRLYPDGPDAAR
jgi:hypothetical protein